MHTLTHDELINRANTIVEALPYIQRYRDKTVVIKYGGNAMSNPATIKTIMQDTATLKIVGVNPILVHGGGPEINSMLTKLNIQSEFVDGMRVTSKEAMDVVQMVLSGKVNKNIVSALGNLGVKAIGLCGKDGDLIEVTKYQAKNGVDYGYVGEITKINGKMLEELSKEYIPVIATIGVDKDGESYNINADIAAGKIGGALNADRLLFLTDVDGIRADEKDPKSLISEITVAEIEKMIVNKQISGGMLPKVQSCITAIKSGIKSVLILNGSIPHAILLELFTDTGVGTLIKE